MLTLQKVLGARQLEVVSWLREGFTNRQIGIVMGLTENTVKKYLLRIFESTSCDNRVSLAIRYEREERAQMFEPMKHMELRDVMAAIREDLSNEQGSLFYEMFVRVSEQHVVSVALMHDAVYELLKRDEIAVSDGKWFLLEERRKAA